MVTRVRPQRRVKEMATGSDLPTSVLFLVLDGNLSLLHSRAASEQLLDYFTQADYTRQTLHLGMRPAVTSGGNGTLPSRERPILRFFSHPRAILPGHL